MKDNTVINILITGVGGQGTLYTSRVLGEFLFSHGYDVKMSAVHGMSQRGGSVITYVKYGKKVYEPIVEPGEADIIIAFEQMEALRYSYFLKEDGMIFLNDYCRDSIGTMTGKEKYPENIYDKLKDNSKVYFVNAEKAAKELGSERIFNTLMLGILAKYMNFDKDEWMRAIEKESSSEFCELNKKAFLFGYNDYIKK